MISDDAILSKISLTMRSIHEFSKEPSRFLVRKKSKVVGKLPEHSSEETCT